METEHPIHTEASLIPGYVSNTLSTDEHQQVADHLHSCTTCQKELQEVKLMQTALKTVIDDRPGPSPSAFNILMSRIEQEKRQALRTEEPQTVPSWGESIQQALRSVFEIQWVPALATVLIVGQSILLFSLMGGPNQQAGRGPGPIIERGIPQAQPARPTWKVQVVFQGSAQAQHIQELIQQWNGTIVDGPSNKGMYTITFPKTEALSMDSLLQGLTAQTTLVESAHPLQP